MKQIKCIRSWIRKQMLEKKVEVLYRSLLIVLLWSYTFSL